MTAASNWTPPTIYNFPPFFTQQPNSDTWQRQKELWHSVVLSYCESQSIWLLNVSDAAKSPLFTNSSIKRSLKSDVIVAVLDSLVEKGRAEWVNAKTKQRCLVWWKSPEEWAGRVYDWAISAGQSICTLFELAHGEATEGFEFHGMEEAALKKALEVLAKQGKGQLFYGSSDSDMGFKFVL